MTGQSDNSTIKLDPWNTPEGAMEEAFLAENLTPDYASEYSAQNALTSMRLMKQVLENRLKDPRHYKARGAKDEFDILRTKGQFPEFDLQGKLQGNAANDVSDILKIANNPSNPHYSAYKKFVQMAIEVAREKLDPSTLRWPNVTGWYSDKNKADEQINHLGSGFEIVGSIGRNTFYKTKAAPSAGKIYDIAHVLGKPLAPSSMMHNIALHQGRPALGGFAPLPRGHKPAPRHAHRHAGEVHEYTHHGGTKRSDAEGRGFRGILADAKAQTAEARRAREARQGVALQRLSGSAFPGHSFAPPPMGMAGLPMGMAARNAMAGGSGFGGPSVADFAPSGPGGTSSNMASTESLRPAPALARNVPATDLPSMAGVAPGGLSQMNFEQALNDYAFQASRLPPNGGAAYNPALAPLFAGMKIPG